jgi:hypothetical protein
MSAKKPGVKKDLEQVETDILIEEDDDETEDEFEDEDEYEDEDEFESGIETEIETEIEHQTPEVVAKELLITFLEKNAIPYPDPLPGESRYQAAGRTIGEMYNALLKEIRKTAAE